MLQDLHKKHSKRYLQFLSMLVMISMLVMSISGCSKGKKDDLKQPVSSVDVGVEEKKEDEEPKKADAEDQKEKEVEVKEMVPVKLALSNGPAEVFLANKDKVANIYIDPKADDYDGLSLVAESFTEDMELVVGTKPQVITDESLLKDTVVIAGSIGNNEVIDRFIGNGTIKVDGIKDKWECYQIFVVDKPMENVEQAIVIVGSDKRGTIYGIYHISEMIGVSPWVYWGDVHPVKRQEITFSKAELTFVSKEPSVQYRGIFLNDEWPSLGGWVGGKFGGFNENFYDEVFKLILRLKGNYMWPAMWSSSFSEDGKSSKIANAALADAYGVVMGTSHHEPMFRAGVEWQRIYKNYGNNNVWDFGSNQEAITKFWEDGLKRNKEFESVITMGMRGEADSTLYGSDEENIQLLKDIILTQKKLLKEQNLENSPLVLTLYKEVEKFWYGTSTVEGLRNWSELDDVIIMLAEDNFGNVRTLPTEEERNREAGWGMYYHFDYHGGPRSYEWVNTTPITKVWEQMSMAYDYGVDKIWVVNVGDLKPMELPISYFLDLAYDFDTWGTTGINKTYEYMEQWVYEQYGAVLDQETMDGITEVLNDYTRMNGNRKPEIVFPDTFSVTNYNEAQRVLQDAIDLETRAKKYLDMMPEAYKDSYYQLVYYPAAASANVVKMNIYSGLNDYYYKQGSTYANGYAVLVQEAINADTLMTSYYNKTMSAGKWNKMMSSNHIGYTHWDDTGWKFPDMKYFIGSKESELIVTLEGVEEAVREGEVALPVFTNLGKEAYTIVLSNGGNKSYEYSIEADQSFIQLDQSSGMVDTGKVIRVSVDWAKVSASSTGSIVVKALGKEIKINVTAEVIDTTGFDSLTHVMTQNHIVIEAERFTANVAQGGAEWKVIDNYGRDLSSLKMYPTTISFTNPLDAPYLEYKIHVQEDGDYIFFVHTAPSNNLAINTRLKYAISIDGEEAKVVDTLNRGFEAGNNGNAHWNNDVMANMHQSRSFFKLSKGTHTIRIYGVDAAVVLQKLIISKGALNPSYFGPEESFYVGKVVEQKSHIFHEPALTFSVPGTISGASSKKDDSLYVTQAVVMEKGAYHVTLKGTVTKDAVINVMVGNIPINNIEWKVGESETTSLKPGNMEQRPAKITVDVRSGEVEITEIIFTPAQ